MNLHGTFAIRAPRDRVFAFLLSPRDLASCVDDPHTVETTDADRFRGTLRSGLGPVRGTFAWSATVVEREPPERARIRVRGTGMGSAFDIDATLVFGAAEGVTTLTWQAEIALSGTIASLGARLMQGTIDKKTNAFFENVRTKLEQA